jgi:glucose/arabinose dehydrogenase
MARQYRGEVREVQSRLAVRVSGFADPGLPRAGRRDYAPDMRRFACALLLALVAAPAARGQTVPNGFTVEPMVTGLGAPSAFDFLPDGRVIFAEQFTAQLRLLRPPSTLQVTPVIAITGVSTGGERGLLGVALDPGFPSRPYVYVHNTVATVPPRIRISRYTLTGDLLDNSGGDVTADPASRYDLVSDIPDNAGNHNGGTVRFGIEGHLYVSLGEDANMCAAQGTTTLRGVILRLRTNTLPPGPGTAFRAQVTPPDNPFVAAADSNSHLVAAFGLRNPFRIQVDPQFGGFVIADVGASEREEIDLLSASFPVPAFGPAPPAAAPLGSNFGWPWMEGTATGPTTCGTLPPDLVAPIYDYDRSSQTSASVIAAGFYRQQAGGVYNWPADHDGDIFLNDYYTGVLRRLKFQAGVWSLAPVIPGQPSATGWGTGFGQAVDWRIHRDGSLWYCRQGVNFAANTGILGRIRGPGNLHTPPGARLALRLVRSPAIGTADLRVLAEVDVRVRIIDAAGRPVRLLWDDGVRATTPGSEFPLHWDGLTDDGERAVPGIYFALVEGGGRRAAVRIPFLR